MESINGIETRLSKRAYVRYVLYLFISCATKHSANIASNFNNNTMGGSTSKAFKDLHVVITGGSSGIGLELAKEYLKNGAHVTIVARDNVKLGKAVAELQSLCEDRSSVSSYSCDVSSSEENVWNVFDIIMKDHGPVDILVNCAGTSIASPFDELPPNAFESMFRANVLGSVYPTRAVLFEMKKRKRGKIIFISSQIAQAAIHGYTAYAASKWALRGLAESLQMEVRPYNIDVSICYPPDTNTPGYEEEMKVKPMLSKKLSESGSVFNAKTVAKEIISCSNQRYFNISIGLDGWLLRQLHPGMSPINNIWEVIQGILFAPIARIISIPYLLSWDNECRKDYELNLKGKLNVINNKKIENEDYKKE